VFALFTAQQKGRQSGPAPTQKLPRLVDLGAKSCVPCKMMAPILEELRNEYKGKLQVEIIDVYEDRSAGDRYRIRFIPTQIFFDPSGKELFRHIGFISKEDILAKWKELGFNLTTTP
jgi:thioredoxin 1